MQKQKIRKKLNPLNSTDSHVGSPRPIHCCRHYWSDKKECSFPQKSSGVHQMVSSEFVNRNEKVIFNYHPKLRINESIHIHINWWSSPFMVKKNYRCPQKTCHWRNFYLNLSCQMPCLNQTVINKAYSILYTYS